MPTIPSIRCAPVRNAKGGLAQVPSAVALLQVVFCRPPRPAFADCFCYARRCSDRIPGTQSILAPPRRPLLLTACVQLTEQNPPTAIHRILVSKRAKQASIEIRRRRKVRILSSRKAMGRVASSSPEVRRIKNFHCPAYHPQARLRKPYAK